MWLFLTGPVKTLQELDRNAFKLGNVDGSLEHSTRFVLIDGHAQIRGYYETSETDAISRLISDAKLLLNRQS
jgi:cytochrome oxidase Cu insertion factor (SCO1/SenC/PrrC family)